MINSELDGLLQRMHRAARAGRDFTAVDAGAVAVLLGVDALTLSITSTRGIPASSTFAQHRLELLWFDPADPLGADLEDLQYTLGEGPTRDALRLRVPVQATDLAASPVARWPVFTAAALTGYRRTPGPFDRHHDIDRFARAAFTLLTHTAPARFAASTPGNGLPLHRARLHQASGILAVQLDIPIDQALLRLRAHAYAHDRPLLDVATDIIAHQLHLPA